MSFTRQKDCQEGRKIRFNNKYSQWWLGEYSHKIIKVFCMVEWFITINVKKAASREEYLSMQNFHFIELSSLHYLDSHVVWPLASVSRALYEIKWKLNSVWKKMNKKIY